MTAILSTDASALRGMTGRAVRIAVVDSGVAAGHPHVGAVSTGHALVGDDPADVADRLGHGTAVAAAIREKAPDAELIPVRVLDRQLATSAKVLARAIHWAVDSGAHLVNLSFGTLNEGHVPLFEAALDAARARGVIVVSAESQEGTPWYPGALAGALGVVARAETPRNAVAPAAGALGAVLAASPYPRPIPGVPVERNLSGVSFAVANATALLALSLQAGAPHDSVDALLAWVAARAVPEPESTR
ncbi:MAG: S8 family serine peptidase [Gemmatimonadota bacterium]